MIDPDLITIVNQSFALQLPENISQEELQQKLSALINELIKNNFEALVALLYKIDVSENKLKQYLTGNPNEDAGDIIAELIIERMQQKAEAKKQFRARPAADDREEKW